MSTQSKEPTVEEMLALVVESEAEGTISQLMDVYESIERSYRAAATAGETNPSIASSTNY